MIEHVIIDLDGTLVDSCGICVEILNEMLLERGFSHEIDYNAARPLMSCGGVSMVSALLGSAASDPVSDLEDFRRRYRGIKTPPEALFPGVALGLAKMQNAGLRLSICSNKPQDLCEAVLSQTGIDHYFEAVVGGAPGLNPKPCLDLLNLVMEKTGAASFNSIFIGDSDLDYAVSLAAGIPFVLMTYGYGELGWQPEGSQSFSSFSELGAMLAINNRGKLRKMG